MDSTIEKVTEVFRVVFENDSLEISEETNAGDIKEWDSFKHLSLLAVLEKTFNIKFDIDDIVSMENVGDIIKVIESKRL